MTDKTSLSNLLAENSQVTRYKIMCSECRVKERSYCSHLCAGCLGKLLANESIEKVKK